MNIIAYLASHRLAASYLALTAAALVSAIASPAAQFAFPQTALDLGVAVLFIGGSRWLGWRRVAAAIVLASVATFADALAQRGVLPRPEGIFSSPNYLGAFAVLAIFLVLLVQLRPWLAAPAIAANLGSIALSQSRAAMLGLIAGLFFVLPRRWRWCYLGLPLALIVIGGLPHFHVDTLSPRIANWLIGCRVFLMRPLLGWGIGSPHPTMFKHFYNVELDWLVSVGLVGMAALAWACVETIRAGMALPQKARGPMLGLFAAYLGNGLLIYDSIGASLVLLVALARLVDRDVSHAPLLVDDHQALAAGAAAVRLGREG